MIIRETGGGEMSSTVFFFFVHSFQEVLSVGRASWIRIVQFSHKSFYFDSIYRKIKKNFEKSMKLTSIKIEEGLTVKNERENMSYSRLTQLRF